MTLYDSLQRLNFILGDDRAVVRYSCGIPSAVTAKLALAEFGHDRVEIVRSNTRSENPDNERFMADCEAWWGKKVTVVESAEYRDIWDVFRKGRFIVSHQGAKCTGVLKREPFYEWSRPSDMLMFGYTSDARDAERAVRLKAASAEYVRFPLIERGLTRSDCMAMVERAGIEAPLMYRLGFNNNNCLGCPKGGMGYWNQIRVHYPVEFERMCCIQDELGLGSWFLVRRGERISLRMLRPEDGRHEPQKDIECSVMCLAAENEIAA